MAELPRYQRANLVYNDMPNLQPVDLQEQLNANKRISAALDQMSSITSEYAKRYAVESAAKYSLDNPVTKEQILEAEQNNSNPVVKNLKGGTVFNDTLKKIYAQQASSELTNMAYDHFENISKQVETGELTDPAAIRESLNSVIKSQTDVLSRIDVETGLSYDAKVKSYANTYYKGALNEIDKQARQKLDLMAYQTIQNQTKMFMKDIENETDPNILADKMALRIQDGDTTFKQGNHRNEYGNQLRQSLEYVMNNRFAEYIANTYGNEGAAMKALEKGNAKAFSKYWESRTPDQQDDLRQFVLKEIRLKDAGRAEFESQYRSKLNMAEDMLKNGFEPDAGTTQWLISNSSGLKPDSAVRNEAAAFNMKINEYHKLNSMSLADRKVYEENTLAKIGADMTPEKYGVYKFIKDANDRFADNIKKDMVGTMKTQTAFRDSALDFNAPEGAFQEQVDKRIKYSKQFAGMNDIKPSFLDEGELNALQGSLNAAKADDKILITRRIAKTFGNDAIKVFSQLAPKDPVMAHMGILSANGSNDDIVRRIAKGEEIIKAGFKYKADDIQKNNEIKKQISDSLYAAPEVYNNVIKTADVLYAEEAMRKGYADVFNSKVYGDKIQEAAGRKMGADGKYYGGTVKYNKNILVIPNTIPQDDFEDMMDKATLVDFRYSSDNFRERKITNGLFSTNGKEYTSDKIKDAKLIPINNDSAMLTIDDQPFILQNGQPLYINLNVLYSKLKSEKRI